MDDADPYLLRRRRGARPQAAAASVPSHISAATPPLPHGKSAMDGRFAHQFAAAASVPLQFSAAAPPPPHDASAMAVNQYQDFLSQSSDSSSSYAASGSSTHPAYLAADEFGLSSQAPPSPFASSTQYTPHMPMENLDLNSQIDGFPHLDIFAHEEQLQADGARGVHGLPLLRPGGRGSLGKFQPPRPSGACSRSGAGSASQSVRRALPLGGSDGAGREGCPSTLAVDPLLPALKRMRTKPTTMKKGNFILLTRVTQTDRVILHLTREPSIIYRRFGKDKCQEVKRSSLIIHILHCEMPSSVLWSFKNEVEDIVRFVKLSNAKAKLNNYGLHGHS